MKFRSRLFSLILVLGMLLSLCACASAVEASVEDPAEAPAEVPGEIQTEAPADVPGDVPGDPYSAQQSAVPQDNTNFVYTPYWGEDNVKTAVGGEILFFGDVHDLEDDYFYYDAESG